ncbi:Allophanate hydrolase [Chlorella vulgaris]
MLAQAVATATRASSLQLAVCGLHLRGQPLNAQLTDLQAVFVRDCKSAAEYKLYAFTDDNGKTKPGMVTVVDGSGSAVYLEVWEMPIENFGHFILQVPPPLAIGTVKLEDGSSVKGFVCEGWVAESCKAGAANVEDITHLGSWLTYLVRPQQ